MEEVCLVVLRVYNDKLKRVIWDKQPTRGGEGGDREGMSLPTNSAVAIEETAAAEFDDFDVSVFHIG